MRVINRLINHIWQNIYLHIFTCSLTVCIWRHYLFPFNHYFSVEVITPAAMLSLCLLLFLVPVLAKSVFRYTPILLISALNIFVRSGLQIPGKPRTVVKSNTVTAKPLTSGGSVGRRSTISYDAKAGSNEKTNLTSELSGYVSYCSIEVFEFLIVLHIY